METFHKLFASLLVLVYHCFAGLSPAAHSSGAHRLFLSRPARYLPHYQAGVTAEDARLPTVGGSLRAQAAHPHSVA
jgi:hypothetical protein